MFKLTFCGAAREVTGSCYLLETDTKKILIDCGLFQGGQIGEQKNLDNFSFLPAKINVVLLTHGHLDHCGRLPRMVQQGFRGPIFATAPTIALAQLILQDSLHILQQEAEWHHHEEIFTQVNVDYTNELFQNIAYHHPIPLAEGITAEFFDAGHILGSAIIKLQVGSKTIIFSGDLGNSPAPLLRPVEYFPNDRAHFIIMESTYGGQIHEDHTERILLLRSAIYETVTRGGTLLVPAFALERTQELLFELNNLVNNKEIPAVPIFLDSPLAIAATQIFKQYPDYYNQQSRAQLTFDRDLFDFPGLHLTSTTAASRAINDVAPPKVIIAGSGMAQGGRILHHIKRYISDERSQYLIIGYQVRGSLGRRLLDGEKKITIHGQKLTVQAKIRALGGYSAHADQTGLTNWVTNFNNQPQQVLLTHGEEEQAQALQRHLQAKLASEVCIPAMGQTFIFD